LNPGRVIRRAVDRIGAIQASPVQLCALFTTTFVTRNLLEAASLGTLFAAPAFFLHFPIAYVFPMTGLAGLLHLFSGYPLGRLLKVMVFAWTLTLLPPLLDLVLGSTSAIGYFPLERSNAAHFLLNFFNPSVDLPGTTAGIRIEAAIGCVLAGIFTASVSEGKRLLRGVLTSVVFAPVFLIFFTWPYLVYALSSGFFPWAEGAQSLMQWHASTEPPLTGAVHYTIFLIDSIPVVLIGGWFISALLPAQWKCAVSSFRRWAPGLIAPLSGASAALITAVSAGAATFADTVAIIGAALAGVLILVSRQFTGGCRWGVAAAALIIAAAAGWVPFVLASLAVSISALPGPRRLSTALLYPMLLLLAASPVSLSLSNPLLAIMLAVALLSGLLEGRSMLPIMLMAVVLTIPILGRPLEGGAWLRAMSRTTDTFTRNTRIAYGLVSAGYEAAAGGGFLHLAETAHLLGMTDRALWAYSVATIRGDSSPEILKVGVNLSFVRGDDEEFLRLLEAYVARSEQPDGGGLISILAAHAAREGDLQQLDHIHSLTGPTPELFQAYSQIHLREGDTTAALSYSEASLQIPGTDPGQYAWAIRLRALTGGDYDGLYRTAEDKFPGSTELMTARLRAPVTAGRAPDRGDLLSRCLNLRPGSGDILETAAIWHLEAGNPDSALIFAERAIAAAQEPELAAFILTCAAASEAGEWELLEAHSRYALTLHPDAPGLLRYLAGSLAAQGRDNEIIFTVTDSLPD
jgi:tetratricopeptide (TPR) repeat protein